MLEFNQQVNAAMVDPGFIASVRRSLTWISAKRPRSSAAVRQSESDD
jgi:hypothetical protein